MVPNVVGKFSCRHSYFVQDRRDITTSDAASHEPLDGKEADADRIPCLGGAGDVEMGIGISQRKYWHSHGENQHAENMRCISGNGVRIVLHIMRIDCVRILA